MKNEDERFLEDLTRAYQENADEDARLAEEFMDVSYEADSIALEGDQKMYNQINEFSLGGIYSATYDGKRYVAFKVINEDEVGVHVAVYNYFSDHFVDFGMYKDEFSFDQNKVIIGHMPILKESFHSIHPTLCMVLPIHEQELDGFQTWDEEHGGYWNDSFKDFLISILRF